MTDALRNLRADSRRFSVYNDGPWAFLYDASFEAELEAMKASEVLVGARVDADVAAAIRARDLLVAYELQQDDPIDAELAVGDPLTTEEKIDLPYLPPRQARLHLPSGRLRLESLNTLSIDDDPTDEPNFEVEVGPGLYLVRFESLELGHDDIAEAQSGVPSEFISLERVTDDVGAGLDPLVALDSGGAAAPIGEVEGDTFRGVVVENPSSRTQTYTNMSPERADELRLTMGQRLQFRTVLGAGHAAYSRFMTPAALERLLGRRGLAKLREDGVDLIAHFVLIGGIPPHALHVQHLAPHGLPERPAADTVVTIRALSTAGLPALRDDLLGKARMKKGRLQSHVLYARPGAFLLNVPFHALRKTGVKSLTTRESPITASFGDQRRSLYFDRRDRFEALDEPRTAFFSQIASGDKVRAEMERLEVAHHDAERLLAVAMRSDGSEREIAEMSAEVDARADEAVAYTLPAGLVDSLPLTARVFPSWRQIGENTLLVEPIIGIRTGLDVLAGSMVELYREG